MIATIATILASIWKHTLCDFCDRCDCDRRDRKVSISAIVEIHSRNDHKGRRVYVSICSQGSQPSLRSLRSYGNQALYFKLQSVKVDSQGRYILLEVIIQDSPFLLLNIYAPNKCSEQCEFFTTISEELNGSFTLSNFSVIVGGRFQCDF